MSTTTPETVEIELGPLTAPGVELSAELLELKAAIIGDTPDAALFDERGIELYRLLGSDSWEPIDALRALGLFIASSQCILGATPAAAASSTWMWLEDNLLSYANSSYSPEYIERGIKDKIRQIITIECPFPRALLARNAQTDLAQRLCIAYYAK